MTVPTAALLLGETVLVRAGEVLPGDGFVVADQAVLTGESRPVTVPVGGQAFAGTTARFAEMHCAVIATGTATRIGAIIVELDAQADRPARLTPFIDRLSAWFTPLILVAVVLVLIGWWWLEQGCAHWIRPLR